MNRRTKTLLLGTAVVSIALVLLARARATPPAEPERATPRVRTPPRPPLVIPPTVDPPVPFVTGAGPHRIESGQTIGIESAALPSEGVLLLELRLPADSVGEEPPVRVISPDGRLIETVGETGAEPGSVGLPLDPSWLRPGRYVIEVTTLERSHFPLRRYALEVR